MTDQSDATQADADAQSQADTTIADATRADASKETISLEEAKKLRSEAANLRKRLKDAEDAAQAAADTEAKAKGEWEDIAKKREAELAEATRQLAERDMNDLKRTIAADEGLPVDLALRLQGDDEDALRTDAKALAKHLKVKDPGDTDAGDRTKPGQKKPDKNAFADPARWGLGKR